jgi:amidohydrolase
MDIKQAAQASIEQAQDRLLGLSHRIHGNPELGFQEEQASTWLCEALDSLGFSPQRGAGGLPTAFTARKGSGPLHIAICAEYDCLPGIGHACGHNMIAAMAVGAAAGAAAVADDAGLTITVVGTPAEEGAGGGKITLLEAGAFEGAHMAMMVHPGPFDVVEPPVIAANLFDIHYTGKAAHAAMFPELGINAADALTVAQTALGLLRQHIKATDRIHGITTKGGEAPNIIPAHTTARYMVRTTHIDEIAALRQRVMRCFEAGALATGATMEVVGERPPYAHMVHDHELASIYAGNAEARGRRFPDINAPGVFSPGSTDMGNLSLALPSIQPYIGLGSYPAVNHQPEFAAHCITDVAERAVMDGAVAMAWTAIDAAVNPAVRDRLTATR